MAQRVDLLIEVDTTLDGSGDYTSPWVETAYVDTVRVGAVGGENFRYVEQSIDGTNVFFQTGIGGGLTEVPLVARYVRLAVDGGTPSAVFRASVRVVK